MIPVSDRPIHLLTLDEAIAERDYWLKRAREFDTPSKYIKIVSLDIQRTYNRLANRCQSRIDELNGAPNA